MMIGNKLRVLREKKGLVLRQVAAALEIDTATMSKIELGTRQARKDQIKTLAEILETDYDELLTLWLASKVYEIIEGEEKALEALQLVGKEIKIAS